MRFSVLCYIGLRMTQDLLTMTTFFFFFFLFPTGAVRYRMSTIALRVITGWMGVREFRATTALRTSPIGRRYEETWTSRHSRSR